MDFIPKLFIAIDHSEEKIAKELIQRLPPKACGIKVGKELFTAVGPKIMQTHSFVSWKPGCTCFGKAC